MSAFLETDTGPLWWLDQNLPFGIVLIDEEIVWFAVYDEDGGLEGAIVNDIDAAIPWVTEMFDSHRHTE